MADAFNRILERHLDAIQERQTETLEEVRGLRVEVQTTYAREVDCAGRAERLHNNHAEGTKRLWETVEATKDRVAKLEAAANVEAGAEGVKSAAWKWLLGILASVVAAAAVAYLVGG